MTQKLGWSITSADSKKVVDQPAHGIIRFFDRDPQNKTLYAVHGDNAIRRRRRNPPDGVPLPTTQLGEDMDLGFLPDGEPANPSSVETLNEYSFEPWDMLARLTSSISSLIYLPASGALAATTFGSDRPPLVYFVSLAKKIFVSCGLSALHARHAWSG